MKKYLAILCSIVGCGILFFSCGEPFSKVQIKAQPELYAPLGNKTLEVKEYLSVEKISELFGDSQSGLKVFDYVAGSQENAMTFLVYYPLMEMDLDFNSYIKDLDMQDLSQAIPQMSFSVPSLSDIVIEPQTLVVNDSESLAGQTLNATTAEMVNKLLPEGGIPLMVKPRTVLIEGEGLESVTFADGNKIVLEIEPTVKDSFLTYSPQVYLMLPNNERVDFVAKDGKYEADFAGKTISVGKIELCGYVTLQGTVTEGCVIGQEGIGVKVNVISILDKGFASATAEVPEGTEVSKTITHDLPETLTGMVSKINFEQVGVKLNLDNNLPAGNNLDITMSVPAFEINDTKPVTADTTELKFIKENLDFVPKTNPSINVVMEVTLPGYNASENTITVFNVVPGETYSLGGTADIVAEWASATIKTENPYTGSFPEDGKPIDMDEFMEKIPEGITFKDVGADFYINSPIQDMTLKGTVKANEDYLLGSETVPADIPVKDALVLPTDGSTEWEKELPESSADLSDKITALLNSKPQSLALEYSLETEEINITKEDTVSQETKIKMELVLRLPLELIINGDELPEGAEQDMKYVKFDIFEMTDVYSDEPDANNDLFNRDEPSEPDEDIDELLSQVKTMTLEIEYNNQLGFETKAEFSDTKSEIKKFFDLKKGNGIVQIKLDGDDVVKIKNAYPFEPRVFLYLPNTDEENPFMLKKDANIEVKLFVVAVSDIDYTYDLREND